MLRLFIDDVLLFLRNPSHRTGAAGAMISTATRFWMAYLTKLCIAITISLPLIYLTDKFVLRLQMNESFSGFDNLFVFIILMVIMAPVLEELVFRFPLRFIKPKFLKLTVYVSSILFGLVHLGNYENQQWLFYVLSPIIVSSQSLGGLVLAYLRLREGILWSMFAHGLFNATLIGIGLLFYQGWMVLDEKNERYSMIIKEYSFTEGKEMKEIYRTGNFIDSIVWKQASLQSLVDSLGEDVLMADQVIVDVEFKTGHPMPADSVLILLKKEFRIE